jgi:SNF2 family DNA or RNA helicase
MYYREKGVRLIRDKIDPYMSGVTKKDIRPDMPEQHIQTIKSTFTTDFMKEYKELLYELRYDLDGSLTEATTTQILQPLLKFIKSVREDNPRFQSLRKLINRFMKHEKVIVWEGSPDIINDLSAYYTERGVGNLLIHGQSKVSKKDLRSGIIQEFNENPDIRILFVSFLTSSAAWEIPSRPDCKRIIYYTIPTSMIQFKQANDRLYRINSQSDVYVYKMLLEGSLDNWLHELIEYKSKVESGFMSQSDYKKIFSESLARYLNPSVLGI